jgi:hypothetical protein
MTSEVGLQNDWTLVSVILSYWKLLRQRRTKINEPTIFEHSSTSQRDKHSVRVVMCVEHDALLGLTRNTATGMGSDSLCLGRHTSLIRGSVCRREHCADQHQGVIYGRLEPAHADLKRVLNLMFEVSASAHIG